MMRLMQNVFTCIKLSQQARIWFALESISLSNDRTQFHYIFSDDIVQFNLNHFKWHNTIQSHQFFLVQMDWTQNLDLKFFHGNVWLVGWSHPTAGRRFWRNIVRLPHHALVPSLEASTAIWNYLNLWTNFIHIHEIVQTSLYKWTPNSSVFLFVQMDWMYKHRDNHFSSQDNWFSKIQFFFPPALLDSKATMLTPSSSVHGHDHVTVPAGRSLIEWGCSR